MKLGDTVRINPPYDKGLPYEFWEVFRVGDDGLVLIIPARKDSKSCTLGQIARYMTWCSPANLTAVAA